MINIDMYSYGTLVNPSSISTVFRPPSTYNPEVFTDKVTSAWRTFQLEYTWRLNSMGKQISRECLAGKYEKN